MEFDSMRKLFLVLALLFIPAVAEAQCNGVFPNNTACGNITGGGTPRPIPLSSFPPPSAGGISGQVQYNNAGAFGGLTNTQLSALINPFSSTLSGSVPASGGSSTSIFLNQAGGWTAAPYPGNCATATAGLVPATGGGTTNFLRADCTFAAPPNTGGGTNDYNIVTQGGALCNYGVIGSVSMASGSTTLASSSANFTSADVGKYIAVQGGGSSGANLFTTISTFVNSTTITLAAANSSGAAISGKLAEYGTDDAASINASIVAAQAAKKNVYVPPGACLASRINLTNASNLIFHGAGFGQSEIFPAQVSSYGGTTGHWFDTTGASYLQIRDLQLGAYYELARPSTGIFQAQVPSGAANVVTIGPNIYLSGQFNYAAIYNYGCPSSSYDHIQVYNYFASPGFGVVDLTATNNGSLQSAFSTVITGTSSTSDITFYKTEIHSFSGSNTSTPTVVYLDGATNISWFGGNITGGAQYYTTVKNVAHISFFNVTFETESQPEPSFVVTFGSGAGTNSDISLIGSLTNLATSGVFNTTPTTTTLVTNGN